MSDEMTAARSAQEAVIARGSKVLHPGVTDLILRLFDAIRSYGPPRVAPERAIYFTEYFKTTEGQPLVWRWANALKHIAENISVAIFDDELIVGRADTWLGRYSLVYPELDGFALALWNGKDSILKEHLFGLTNSEANHGRGPMASGDSTPSTTRRTRARGTSVFPESESHSLTVRGLRRGERHAGQWGPEVAVN